MKPNKALYYQRPIDTMTNGFSTDTLKKPQTAERKVNWQHFALTTRTDANAEKQGHRVLPELLPNETQKEMKAASTGQSGKPLWVFEMHEKL